jgi:hypothetical protein
MKMKKTKETKRTLSKQQMEFIGSLFCSRKLNLLKFSVVNVVTEHNFLMDQFGLVRRRLTIHEEYKDVIYEHEVSIYTKER